MMICLMNSIDDNVPFIFFSGDISISRYHPVVSDIRFITLQISLMYGFTSTVTYYLQ